MTARYHRPLTYVAGGVIILFGLHLTGILKIKALYADKRLHSVQGGKSPIGAFVVGFAFAFGWTPCIGPVLAGILTLAASEAVRPYCDGPERPSESALTTNPPKSGIRL